MAGGPYNPMGGGGGGMGGPMGGNMGGPPPMGGPPMLGPPPNHQPAPMGPPTGQRPKAMRQGTSRAVPVVVSAGLAIGVFCGLLFGVGTGQDVIASPATGTNAARIDKVDDVTTTQQASNDATKKPAAPATGTTPATPKPAAGSAGSGTPAVAGAKLTIGLKPETLAKTAFVTVDGNELKDGVMDVAFDAGGTKKTVKVVVKAAGYTDVEKTIEVDADTRVEIELLKAGKSTPAVATGTPATGTPATTAAKPTGATATKPTGSTSSSSSSSTSKPKPPKPPKPAKPPGTLIDI
ncbi:MAG: hypothetical protein H0T79_22285 [Deltaproteobacteria bacterium]|nr:hypothetical protein [Deltaproteobacteria bacterium]